MESGYIGKVATCSKGIKGYIIGFKQLSWGNSYVGFRQDDGGPWASRNPEIVDEEPSFEALSAAQAYEVGGAD